MDKTFYDISLIYKFEELVDNLMEETVNDCKSMPEKIIKINPLYIVAYIKYINSYLLFDYTEKILLKKNSDFINYLRQIWEVIDKNIVNALIALYEEYFYYFTNIVFKKKILTDCLSICKKENKEYNVERLTGFLEFYGILFNFITKKEMKEILCIDSELFCYDYDYTKKLCLFIKKL
jgi:hypothetical protein